jgi:hypothetical protein
VLLEAEGVCFDAQARVDLARYRWHPQVRAVKTIAAGRNTLHKVI